MKEINIAIGLSCSWPFIPVQFFQSWIQMKKPSHSVIFATRGRADDMRNSIINQIIKDDSFSHILFLDLDHRHHQDTIPKLLSHNKSIVSGLSFRRSTPYDPIMFKREEDRYKNITSWDKDSLVEVDAIGAASLLVELDVFKRMDTNKYFEMNYPFGAGVISEDFAFCLKAKEIGYKIYCDTSCTNDHLGELNVNESTWKTFGQKSN